MVGGIVGIILKCTFLDHIGFESASRNRRKLLRVQGTILILSFILSSVVLGVTLQEEMGVVKAMPLGTLQQEYTWADYSNGRSERLPSGWFAPFAGEMNLARLCQTAWDPLTGEVMEASCSDFNEIDAQDRELMNAMHTAYVDPATNTLCALSPWNGDWLAAGLSALFPLTNVPDGVEILTTWEIPATSGGCVNAFDKESYSYGEYSEQKLTCYVAPRAAGRAAGSLAPPNPFGKLSQYDGCYPPRPECTAMPCASLNMTTLSDASLRAPIWKRCAAAARETRIVLIIAVVLGALRVLMICVFRNREDVRSDHGWKGLNLIGLLVPLLGSITTLQLFQWRCLDALQAYDIHEYNATLGAMVFAEAHARWGPSLILLALSVGLYVPCIAIELLIPAGKHALKGSRDMLPPPPLAEGADAPLPIAVASSAASCASSIGGGSFIGGGKGILSRMMPSAFGSMPMVAVAGSNGTTPSKDRGEPTESGQAPPPLELLGQLDLSAAVRKVLSSAARCLAGGGEEIVGSDCERHFHIIAVRAAFLLLLLLLLLLCCCTSRVLSTLPWFRTICLLTLTPLSTISPRSRVQWEGPRTGECNDETIGLSDLIQLCEQGLVPRDAYVWPCGVTRDDGASWRPVGEVVDQAASGSATTSRGEGWFMSSILASMSRG